MPLHIAFQMDALEMLNQPLDTTLELARAAHDLGHKLFHYEPEHIHMSIHSGRADITAAGHDLIYSLGDKNPWSLGAKALRTLSEFDVILMRQDPPFDLAYITATHILEQIKDKVRIVNDPVGVRNAPEKLLITHVPQLMPPTLITREREAIESFRDEHKDIIFKPLHGFAGHGIFHLRPGDDNLPGLIETMSSLNAEPWMIQKYLPVTELGDKRIVILNGEPVGLFRRMPAAGDARSNMRVGGRPEKATLTKRDVEICTTVAPMLRERGLFLVGLDVIGDYLTEINVTSPTGLVVADQLEGRTGTDRIADRFWQQLTA
jgi:glutathione synthase